MHQLILVPSSNYVPSFAITEPLESINNLHNTVMHALDPFIEKIEGKAEYFFQIPNQLFGAIRKP